MTRFVIAAVLAAGSFAHAQQLSAQVAGQLPALAGQLAPGQAPASQVFGGFARENVEMPYMVPLELGRCYTFIGTVGMGVNQLSIYLFDPTGRTVAKDTTDKSISPRITHCTRWPGMYKILGKIKRGDGEFAIQAFSPGGAPPPQAYAPPPPQAYAPPPPQAYAQPQQPVSVAQPAPQPAAAPTPPPGYMAAAPPPQSPLGGQLRSIASGAAPGQVPASQVFGGFAGENVEMPFPVSLEVGRCYTFVGTVGPGVNQLSIYLFDPTGRSVAKDTTDKSIAPRFTHCTRWPGIYKLLGKIKRGAGEFAMQAYTPGGAPAPQPTY